MSTLILSQKKIIFMVNKCFRFDEKQNSSSRKSSLLGGGSGSNSSHHGSRQSLASPVKTAQVSLSILLHYYMYVFDCFNILSFIFVSMQFGVTLKFINENSPCLNYIPPVVRMCVDHLSLSDGEINCLEKGHIIKKIATIKFLSISYI